MLQEDELLRMLEQDYPGQDWDVVPDPATLPDIYVVQGQEKKGEHVYGFEIITEFATPQEAQTQAATCNSWETVVPGSVKVVARKPHESVCKHFYKEQLSRLREGRTHG